MWDILDKESQEELIPPLKWQHAYRSDKGTDTAIAEQVDLIESGIYGGKYAPVFPWTCREHLIISKLSPSSGV